MPGLGRDRCQAMIMTDAVDHTVTWRGDQDLSALAGKPVRLRFFLRGARIYSFWVSE